MWARGENSLIGIKFSLSQERVHGFGHTVVKAYILFIDLHWADVMYRKMKNVYYDMGGNLTALVYQWILL